MVWSREVQCGYDEEGRDSVYIPLKRGAVT